MILNGLKVAKEIRNNLFKKANKFEELYKRKISLAVIVVGNNKASEIYVRKKKEACDLCNINSILKKYDNIKENELIEVIKSLNNDKNIDGILVQLPLPANFNETNIINTINKDKDVDGLTINNIGLLVNNQAILKPCTPSGIMEILHYYNINIESKNVVILGRSNIVGKPLLHMLINENATVTLCHSKTNNLKFFTKHADIIIVAIGKAKYLTKEFVSRKSVIIDVGINRIDNKIYGDVDFDQVKSYVKHITPVPKGVGSMTVTMLLKNTVTAAFLRQGEKLDVES